MFMPPETLYSDRTQGTASRNKEFLPENTAKALLSLVQNKINTNWFAREFPKKCPDCNAIVGTDEMRLRTNLDGTIEGLNNPLDKVIYSSKRKGLSIGSEESAYYNNMHENISIEDHVIFDLLEYAAERIAKPEEDAWHDYFKHYHLQFDEKDGRKEFQEEVNRLLLRGNSVYEFALIDGLLRIRRLVTPEVQRLINELRPDTKDAGLDNLIVESCNRYLSRKVEDRKIGLDRLWDALDRLKTIDIPGKGNKRDSTVQLLAYINDEDLRKIIEKDMCEINSIGNDVFQIRHYETDKLPVPLEGYDYLFSRLSNLIITLLHVSNRLIE